jgi:hypothetical protein
MKGVTPEGKETKERKRGTGAVHIDLVELLLYSDLE